MLGNRLQVVTFDKNMTALYEHAFDATGCRAVVAGWMVVDVMPAKVAKRPAVAVDELQSVCRRLSKTSTDPIFVVGAVGLALTERMREDGFLGLVDPVSDLLAWLKGGSNEC